MKVETNMAEIEVVLRMTGAEAEKLSALTDFPNWGGQPDDIAEFCDSLYEKLSDAGFTSAATIAGFRNSTSVV